MVVFLVKIAQPVPFYMTVHGIMAQQQSSSHTQSLLIGLMMLATVEEAGLLPAGGMFALLVGEQ